MIFGLRFHLTLLACFGLISPSLATPDPGKKALEEFFGKIRQQSLSGNTKELTKLARDLFPNRESIEKGLSSHIPQASIEKLTKWHEEARASTEAQLIEAFTLGTKQSKIVAYAATVKSLILSEKGSDAYRHFPRGAQFFARDSTLRDDTTYYKVVITEPGNAPFRNYDLIFWDGESWKVLGAIWNLLEAEDPLLPPPLNAPAEAQREHLKKLKDRLVVYQKTAEKAKTDIGDLLSETNKELNIQALQEMVARSIDASKLAVAMQVKIPKLEERIKRQTVTVALLDIDLGDLSGFENDLPTAKPNPATTPTTPLALLKRELRFLKIAKSATAKDLKKPDNLTREELVKLTSKLLEIDEFITAKTRKIEKLTSEKAD